MLFEVWLMSMKTPDISREHSYIYHTVLICIGTLMNVQHLCQHIYPQRFCTVLLSETQDNMNHTPILTMQTWQHTLSSFHHDVPLAINQVAAESVCDNWIGTCGKTTKIHSSHHTPEEFLFVCFASLALLRAWFRATFICQLISANLEYGFSEVCRLQLC